jgi:hypothetical protein
MKTGIFGAGLFLGLVWYLSFSSDGDKKESGFIPTLASVFITAVWFFYSFADVGRLLAVAVLSFFGTGSNSFVANILKNTDIYIGIMNNMKAAMNRAGLSSKCADSTGILSFQISALISVTLFVLAILAAFDVYVDGFSWSALTVRRTVAVFFIFASFVLTM